jgi:hypothetical protein
MIRYRISETKLKQMIELEAPGWLERARIRTESFRRAKRYYEDNSIWAEVKTVYMRVQGDGKCAYCEREMESEDYGRIEQDVEHFRPKARVKLWKVPKWLRDEGAFQSVVSSGAGYYLLPYNIFNYAAACKPCNSILKRDQFPIAGKYKLDADDPSKLAGEKAYLLYPVGSIDSDPERIIAFRGLSPCPVAKSGHARLRALVIIDFFKLDDPEKRKNLYRDRALIIMALFPLLQNMRIGTQTQRKQAKVTVNGFLRPQLRHLNCAKSFYRLYESDLNEARAIFNDASKFMTSIS